VVRVFARDRAGMLEARLHLAEDLEPLVRQLHAGGPGLGLEPANPAVDLGRFDFQLGLLHQNDTQGPAGLDGQIAKPL
jgi:hypothetical protein